MWRFAGTLIGLVVGALGGVAGALFGGALGLLADQVWAEYRIHRCSIRYLRGRGRPGWLDPFLPLAAAAAVELRLAHGRRIDDEVRQRLAEQVRAARPSRFPRHLTARMADRVVAGAQVVLERPPDEAGAAPAGTVPSESPILRLCADDLSADERSLLLDIAWRLTPDRPAFLAVAGRWGLDESEADRIIVDSGVPPRSADADDGPVAGADHSDDEAFRILGVAVDAGWEEIRSAYRTLASQFHPDTAGPLSEDQRRVTEAAFVRIQTAYERLRDRRSAGMSGNLSGASR